MGHVYAWRWIVGYVEFYWVPMIRVLGAAEILASGEMRCVSEVGKREKEYRAILGMSMISKLLVGSHRRD